jgi:hypothetical protein
LKDIKRYNNPLCVRRIILSDDPNHVNLHAHRASSIATSSRDLSPSNKEPQEIALPVCAGENIIKQLRHFARQEEGLCVSLEVVSLLLQVIILAMTLRPHSLRLEVAAIQQLFHLLRVSPLRVLNRRISSPS